jgi:dipeptidyl aminopeptidase/acylaminoacyl peptidase
MFRFITCSLALISLVLNISVFAQNKVIDHTVYDAWKKLTNENISASGKYVSYEVNPHRGDGVLHVQNVLNGKEWRIPRSEKASFCQNEDYLVFTIQPGYDTLRTLELEKVNKKEWVKDTLGILWLESDSLVKVPNVLGYKIGKHGNHLAYLVLKDSILKEEKKKKCKLFKKKNKEEEILSDGNTLFILNSSTNKLDSIAHVTQYDFNDKGTHLYLSTHKKVDKADVYQMHVYNVALGQYYTYTTGFTNLGPINFSKEGNLFAFMASVDTAKETRLYDVYLWNIDDQAPQSMVSKDRSDLPENLTPSNNSKLRFSLDESKLYFGLHDVPEKEEKDTLLESEKATLDVWHYQNKRLQPQQLKELKRDQKASHLSVLHLKDNKLIQLATDTLTVRTLDQGNANYALAYSNERYAKTFNWSYPWPSDYYRIDLLSGETELIKETVNYSTGLTPNGKYFVYFKSNENQYYSIDIETKDEVCMTCFIKDTINWRSDINGMPFEANPEGSPGYLSDNEIILYSEFDVWKFNFIGNQLTPISLQRGKEQNTIFRLKRLDYDSTYIEIDHSLLIGVDQKTMDETVYTFVDDRLSPHLVPWYTTNHKLIRFHKADEGDALIFRQMNVKDYPDLFITNMQFENPKKISNANPQQSEYVWPTVEQVQWTSYDGKELNGLLYKPDNYDATKTYPLMVYFYEMYSDRKNFHYIPKPTASIIYATEYASAGYLVFFPDIRYEPGYPAQGAYDCIMSGTDKILELYPNVDSTRMGLQGQSWGGYQTAQLITMTDRYAAAMAGAPVSNMFSAYGGIRWGSGLNRAFQYEHTQSRIGKTIWEAPELYMENSPLFGVPNIHTPLLIMHNDNDGAVPWYQGIEMFTAMKRLNKPVWMLNYNGDDHNLMINANREDLSIRMRQFFDHYLQGKPAPEWLIKGVPAIEKRKNYGLEEYKEGVNN